MEAANNVRLVILDIDGVMTDGRVIHHDDGSESRNFDIKDGLGVVALQMTGIEVGVITKGKSAAVRNRAEELKIKHYYEGAKKKTDVYDTLLEKLNIDDSQVAYVGDDLVDLGMMKRVGFSCAVADAVEEVKQVAGYVTKARGGYGAVREVAELILKAQGKWDLLLEKIG
ncbi:KdsC family phosphatase [Aromatoleum buckelii]|uniref:HAD-IIIA family hydrolase n=1 Tax=Aromatoleum buckelii TaxID=200254 RepID=A0ABX1N362_9RHOO|nr:HAD-IIIA family hydrolase [Aromatoleum buckelii]MCK0513165.1 HAD-IIIA family hydrolase [Aromatoleum buckelii]